MPAPATVQNLVEYSEDPSNVYWTQNALTLTGAQADPFGGTGAWLFSETVANALHQNYAVLLSSQPMTLSCYMKAGTSRYGVLAFQAANYGVFDLQAGTAVAVGCTVSMTSIGNGWYRCAISTTTPSIGVYALFSMSNNANTWGAYVGNAANNIVVFGFQYVHANWAGPYFKTTAQPVDNGSIRNLA